MRAGGSSESGSSEISGPRYFKISGRSIGSARQVADGIAYPNGMVVTRDNSTLIVAESYAKSSQPSTLPPTGAYRTAAFGPTSARASPTVSASTPKEPSDTRTVPMKLRARPRER